MVNEVLCWRGLGPGGGGRELTTENPDPEQTLYLAMGSGAKVRAVMHTVLARSSTASCASAGMPCLHVRAGVGRRGG